MTLRARVTGCGVAGLAAASRLARSGWEVQISSVDNPTDRIVTLDPSVEQLFLMEYGDGFFEKIPAVRMTHRTILWDRESPQYVDGPMMSLALEDLISVMSSRLPENVESNGFAKDYGADFHLLATGRPSEALLRSGDRTAFCWVIDRRVLGDSSSILASRDGWMFLCPVPLDRTLVQYTVPGQPTTEMEFASTVDGAESILSDHGFTLLSKQLRSTQYVWFDATPVFSNPTPTESSLAIGDAAFAGDPLAGDGIGRAMRSAVHAAAVLSQFEQRSELMQQYAGRMALAHMHCLQALTSFYETSACRAGFSSAIRDMKRDAKLLENFSQKHLGSNKLLVKRNSQRLVNSGI